MNEELFFNFVLISFTGAIAYFDITGIISVIKQIKGGLEKLRKAKKYGSVDKQ